MMAFNQSTMRLDDSPKSRCLEKRPDLKCRVVNHNGHRVGFLITLNEQAFADGQSAYKAWQRAEARIFDESKWKKEQRHD
jgi:hypothetical protein